MFDVNCKYNKDCGADMCHGEGVCPDFIKAAKKCITTTLHNKKEKNEINEQTTTKVEYPKIGG